LVIGLVAFVTTSVPAGAHDLPDLVADPPENPELQVDSDESGEERLLLRFDGHVHNAGAGPLEVRRQSGAVEQILRDGATLEQDPLDPSNLLSPDAMKFENTDGHNHFHLQRIARYSLYDGSGTAPVAPVMKVGFCLLDSPPRVSGTAVPRYDSNCGRRTPDAPSVTMGVSSGWRDVYHRSLPFQYVDISETQPGAYRLRSEIDPDDLIEESDETNNLIPGELNSAVPGYLAMLGDAVTTSGAVALSLAGNGFGTGLGAKRFRIADAPDRGTLSVPTGQWFDGPGVTYTDGDAAQPDRFTYVADDAGSNYPRHPGRATVLLNQSGVERVAMWGVPEKLRAGMTVDLGAEVRDGSSATVTWSTTAGTVDSGGRFTAPLTIPAGGKVTVTATGPEGAQDAMDIEVTQPFAPPKPAPRPGNEQPGTVLPTSTPVTASTPAAAAPGPAPHAPAKPAPRKRTPIGGVRVRRIGPQLVLSVVARASGRVRATLLNGRRRLGTCTVRVRAKRAALCRLRVRRDATAILVTLVRRDGAIEQRRISVTVRRS
jgi:hypothetical protein